MSEALCDLPSLCHGWRGTPGSSSWNRGHSWLLILLIYLSSSNERRQTRRKQEDVIECPRITHSRLLSPPQTFLSNRTGHGQLWHVPEQRMHYLQVGHCSSEAKGYKCALGKCRGGERDSREIGKGQEDSTLMWILLMSTHRPFHTMFSFWLDTPPHAESVRVPVHVILFSVTSQPSLIAGGCFKCGVSWILMKKKVKHH